MSNKLKPQPNKITNQTNLKNKSNKSVNPNPYLYLSSSQIAAYNKQIDERKQLLESNPEYTKVANRLDTLIGKGSVCEFIEKYYEENGITTETINSVHASILHNQLSLIFFKFLEKEYDPESKDILINVNKELWEIIRKVYSPMELTHVSLELYKMGFGTPVIYICEAEELRSRMYEFNVWRLIEENKNKK